MRTVVMLVIRCTSPASPIMRARSPLRNSSVGSSITALLKWGRKGVSRRDWLLSVTASPSTTLLFLDMETSTKSQSVPGELRSSL